MWELGFGRDPESAVFLEPGIPGIFRFGWTPGGFLENQGLRSKQPKPWAWLAVVAVAGERCGSHQLVSLKRGSTDKMVPSVGQSFDLTGKLLTSPGLNTWSRFLT